MLEQISALTSSTDNLLKSVSETRFMNGGPETAATGQAGETVSFGDTLAQVSQDAIQRLKDGEAASLAGVDGQASVQQVVEAVMAAEQSLQTAIAIRDKVVGAYQEISRMTI
ncbi:flagellar hook-basal body complex protein FliE [uncultured Roseibium sp.]|uniref:flagellar hook-basal body complex protein FliE n=1 Tax=uncultured Roseibium sp. TaxID=1936171 RepID=UPI0032167CBB